MIVVQHQVDAPAPRIAVMGVGGGGGNAVDAMIRTGLAGIDSMSANTDAQALNASLAEQKIQLGRMATRGLGAGAAAEIGRKAAEEALPALRHALAGVDMLFIAAGMGGGTGTGAAPVIARLARSCGILTVAVATTPFSFEGRRRLALADRGLEALALEVDTLIVIPNQNLFRMAGPDTSLRNAFHLVDKVLAEGMRSISDLIATPGLVNLDFADVRAVMSGMGTAVIGTGEAEGPGRALEAAEAAISNPLLDGTLEGATGLIISIASGEDLRLAELDEAVRRIRQTADPEAELVWGSTVEPSLDSRMRVSIVATALPPEARPTAVPAAEPRSGATEAGLFPGPPPEPAAAPPTGEEELKPASAQVEHCSGAASAATLFERMAGAAHRGKPLFPGPPPPPQRARRILLRA